MEKLKEFMVELEFDKEDREFLHKEREQMKEKGEESNFVKLVQDFLMELPSDIFSYEMKLKDMGERAEIHPYTMNLLFLLEIALERRAAFQKEGYGDRLFLDTMMDMKWKLQECKEVYGIAGNFVFFWYPEFFRMTRFTLGRLQFELMEYSLEDYQCQETRIQKGDFVINMHVPSSGALTEEAWEASISQAMEFFADKFVDGVYPFYIESWLIDPDLLKMLPDGNMKKFADLFTLLEVNKQPSFEDGWRVFGSEWTKEPEQLPRKTRLQRQIAQYLEKGGELGSGTGIFIRKH